MCGNTCRNPKARKNRSVSSANPGHIGVGRRGEDEAARYLQEIGYRLVERNWKCRIGELDLICVAPQITAVRQRGEVTHALVFIEVKSRTGERTAGAHLFDNITLAKQRRLRMLAELYLRQRPSLTPAHNNPQGIREVRIDIIGVIFSAANDAEIQHLINAV